jgi:hypothetical protein
MASFTDLVRIAARAATHRVAEGSRRNARASLDARYESLRHGSEVLAALPVRSAARDSIPLQSRHRPSA